MKTISIFVFSCLCLVRRRRNNTGFRYREAIVISKNYLDPSDAIGCRSTESNGARISHRLARNFRHVRTVDAAKRYVMSFSLPWLLPRQQTSRSGGWGVPCALAEPSRNQNTDSVQTPRTRSPGYTCVCGILCKYHRKAEGHEAQKKHWPNSIIDETEPRRSSPQRGHCGRIP